MNDLRPSSVVTGKLGSRGIALAPNCGLFGEYRKQQTPKAHGPVSPVGSDFPANRSRWAPHFSFYPQKAFGDRNLRIRKARSRYAECARNVWDLYTHAVAARIFLV